MQNLPSSTQQLVYLTMTSSTKYGARVDKEKRPQMQTPCSLHVTLTNLIPMSPACLQKNPIYIKKWKSWPGMVVVAHFYAFEHDFLYGKLFTGRGRST